MEKPRGKSPQKREQTKHRSFHGKWLLWLGAILVLTFAVYLPSLDNDFTSWDDNGYVAENAAVTHSDLRALLTVPLGGNYHPLTMLSLALNYKISGLNAASYHWLNLLLHLANTALVFLFVRRLSGGRFWTTVATALFFGIHPMHVESVAWVAERKDVLYAFFYLLALIAYLAYLDTRRRVWLGATLLAFVLSAASKPAAVVLPLMLLAIDYYRRRPTSPSVVLEKVPFFAVSIAAGLLTMSAQGHAGAIVNPHLWSLPQKVLFASYATIMYIVKLFVPTKLSVVYPYPNVSAGEPLSPIFYAAFLALAILLPVVAYLSRRVPAVLFGLGFFFINIILVLQLLPVGSAIVSERYTYLPYIGLFFALTWWLDEPTGTKPARLLKPLVAGSLLLLLPVSVVQTWTRCDVWRNDETLLNDTIQKYPHRIWYVYWHRGYYYFERDRFDRALADFNEALALNSGVASVWMHKGSLLAMMNRNDSAFVCTERAIELKPDYTEALSNRGGLKVRMGDLAGALDDFARAIALDPRFRDAYTNRAAAYAVMKDYDKANADRRRAIELDPTNPANYRLFGAIGVTLQKLNRDREAIPAYDEAIRRAPRGDGRLGEYYLNRSRAWWALHDPTRARDDAREAVRLGARVPPAYLQELGG